MCACEFAMLARRTLCMVFLSVYLSQLELLQVRGAVRIARIRGRVGRMPKARVWRG